MSHVCPPTTSTMSCSACILTALNASTAIKLASVSRSTRNLFGWKPRGGMSALDLGLFEAASTPYDANGLWLEFGVYRGGSTRKLRDGRFSLAAHSSSANNTMVFGFDSFQGLPETWRKSSLGTFNGARIDRRYLSRGAFSLRGQPPYHRDGIGWVIGWFNESLPGFLQDHSGHAKFVHIDSDLYSSAKTVLTLLVQANRLKSGTILVFDELINYPEFMDGELKALCELLASSSYRLRVLGTGASVVLPDAASVKAKLRTQHAGRETPHSGRYRQDAAFVLTQ